MLGFTNLVAVFLGASLTATSVGISARVLSDLGHLQDREAQIILGAAVLGILLFQESVNPMRLFFLGMLLVSIVGLRLAA